MSKDEVLDLESKNGLEFEEGASLSLIHISFDAQYVFEFGSNLHSFEAGLLSAHLLWFRAFIASFSYKAL